jgi:hypothetical protein
MTRALAAVLWLSACSTSQDGGANGGNGAGGAAPNDSTSGGAATGGASTLGSGGEPGTCIFEPEAECSLELATDCLCVGCNDECNGAVVSDCLCGICDEDAFCSDPAACTDDGACDPFNEACHCADCSSHPLCAT